MVTRTMAKAARRAKLYRSAKISDYRFRQVLEQFVQDASASDAARATNLSINSTHAIYRKLRVFFYEVGLFMDFYEGKNPVEYNSDNPHLEFKLLEFHFQRMRDKHGLKQPLNEPPYHFAESCWRYDFRVIAKERPSEAVHAMVLANLLELIRLCGPIGAPPKNREAGMRAVARQFDQRVRWLERSAPGFADESSRLALREIRAIDLDAPAPIRSRS